MFKSNHCVNFFLIIVTGQLTKQSRLKGCEKRTLLRSGNIVVLTTYYNNTGRLKGVNFVTGIRAP